MPIIRAELEVHRRNYNSYPMRKNVLSNLPAGPPEDNYNFRQEDADFAVYINPEWLNTMRRNRLANFDADQVFEWDTKEELDAMMLESPYGLHTDISNAKEQYLYLREQLHTQLHIMDV
jgi:hypothetical protein